MLVRGHLARKEQCISFYGQDVKKGWQVYEFWLPKKWIDKVIEVKRISERIMVLRLTVGKSVFNIVSVYAQVGRSTEEKEEFYGVLEKSCVKY